MSSFLPGALEACKAIISKVGVDCLKDVDNHNRTCLHMAAMAAHGEVLNYLLEQGGKLQLPLRKIHHR